MAITLTPYERTVLINQYKILKTLGNEEQDYDRLISIAEHGYAYDYPELLRTSSDDEYTTEVCTNVRRILGMFYQLHGYISQREAQLTALGVNLDNLRFDGFDAHETQYYHYATFLIESGLYGQYNELAGHMYDNHGDTSFRSYLNMLALYERLKDEKQFLDNNDLQEIANAR